MRHVLTTCMLLTAITACSRGVSETATTRASKIVSVDTGSACPPSRAPGPAWRVVETRDGRAELSLPRAFTLVPADSAEIWADSASSIGYKTRDRSSRRAELPAGEGWCTERISGVDARLWYDHARAAFGEGQYVRVLLTTSNGMEFALSGFAQDSAVADVLLTIVRSLRVKTP